MVERAEKGATARRRRHAEPVYTKVTRIRLQPELYDLMAELAADDGETTAELIRTAMTAYLVRRGKLPAPEPEL